jgi:hypothetical protein
MHPVRVVSLLFAFVFLLVDWIEAHRVEVLRSEVKVANTNPVRTVDFKTLEIARSEFMRVKDIVQPEDKHNEC